jgi:hypothetical protein
MSVDNYIALFSAAISFSAMLLVVLQLRDATDQRRVESLLEIYGINRTIISFGFTNPELFRILHGEKGDPLVEQHYLQLWFNQFALIHSFYQRKFFPRELCESLERDINEFMALPNVRRHWENKRRFYPLSFQAYVDRILAAEAGAPVERPPAS